MKPVYEWFTELKEYQDWSHLIVENYEGYQRVRIMEEHKCCDAIDWLHANQALVSQADWIVIDHLFLFTTEEQAMIFKLSVDL